MAFLHLPLAIASDGSLERAKPEEDTAGSRLRLFIYSGAGEYLKLPTSGVRTLWVNLYNIGVSSRLCDVLKEDERRELENLIKRDINAWLDGTMIVTNVVLLGDEQEENGIKFRTENREFVFTFHFVKPSSKSKSSVGSWQIKESSYAVF